MHNARRHNDGQEQPSLLLILLDPLTWFCSRDWIWRHAPRRLDALCQIYLNWYLSQTLVVRMQQAELRGIGCADTWMPLGTETAAVTQWFEQQVLDEPRAAVDAFDYIAYLVFDCSADERATVAWITFPPTQTWLGSGRDGVATGGAKWPLRSLGLSPTITTASPCSSGA